MKRESINPYFHIFYWLFTILILTAVFGSSWGNALAAFYFICMLLPIVMGTSYFFNYYLVPKYYLRKKYLQFSVYSVYTIIVSLYLEMIVLTLSFIYLGNFKYSNLAPNASNTILLAVLLYLLVFLGSFLLMSRQIRENQRLIQNLLVEKEKREIGFLELLSNRKRVKIRFSDILYIESLADYVKVHTAMKSISSKEKIGNLESMLPDFFLRIHRSFIVNTHHLDSFTSEQVNFGKVQLNIGRTYRKKVKEFLQG